MGVLSAALGRYVGDGTLDDLQKRLLNALAAYVACDGGILAASGNLVDLVDVDYAALSRFDIVIGSLNESQQNVLNVLADISRLGQRCCVRDCERNIQQLRQGLRQHCLSDAGRAEQQHVGLLKLYFVVGFLVVEEGSLVVVVNGHTEDLLCLVLSDDVLIKISLDLLGLHKLAAVGDELGLAVGHSRGSTTGLDVAAFHKHIVGSEHALVADHGFFAKTSVEDTAYFILALSAKGANHHNICIPLK